MYRTTIVLIACLVSGPAAWAQDKPAAQRAGSTGSRPGIHKLEELTWPQVDALDRERTLFMLPVGMLEVHGPHLPIGTDILGLNYEADRASRRLSLALPDWNIVMMPPISYGQGGANELGGRLVHPGTYAIRQSTLRALVADLGGQVAQNGFKWVFVLNGHGAPTHNIAINEACDFISETFRVTMLHVTGLLRADAAIQSKGQKVNARYFSADQLSSFGMDVHAGVGETSGVLAIRPDLVSPQYKKLPGQVGRSLEELRDIAAAPGWQGYLSDPAKATAAHGRAVEGWWIEGFADLILRAVRGENMFAHPRFPDTVPAPVAASAEKALANEAAFAATLEKWLLQRPRR
jgi:creatinine amidohydrolase